MVKHFQQTLRHQQYILHDQLLAKANFLSTLIKKDHIKDVKRQCKKNNIQYTKQPQTLHDVLQATSDLSAANVKDQVQRQVAVYKIALQNVEKVLDKLNMSNVKNQRPHDYLVEMYKSDKQMFKVRRYIADKQSKIKEKMQGKDWLSKTKRKQRAQKKAQAKKAKKKAKLQAKRPQIKPKMDKVNGKNKLKR